MFKFLSIPVIIFNLFSFQHKIYYIKDSVPVDNNYYQSLAVDEKGEGYNIKTKDNIKNKWIYGDSLKLAGQDEYIFNFILMD